MYPNNVVTKVREHANPANLFSVENLLCTKGFEVQLQGDGTDTLLQKTNWTGDEANEVLNLFKDKSKRNQLLRYIEKGKDSCDIEVQSFIEKYEIKKELPDEFRERFSHTYEWAIAYLFRMSLAALSSAYGVEIKNIYRNSDNQTSGDFDVLAILRDSAILYAECKTGKFDLNDIKKSIERSISIHAVASFIFISELKEIQLVSMLNDEKAIHPLIGTKVHLKKISIKDLPNSTVYKWLKTYFIIESDDNELIEQIRCALRLIEADKIVMAAIEPPDYERLGYVEKNLP